MDNKKEIRWKQRFVNFEKSFRLLERTIAIKDPSEAEKGGIIQFYEVCFELSWKVMKDYLESEGYIVKSPKQTLKQAFQIDLITEGELWIMALEDRNLTAHTYDEETTEIIINKIINDYFPLIEALYYRLKKEVSE
jgi:nucleotidyltransferase substrate binding protein (TIGR01987 family)